MRRTRHALVLATTAALLLGCSAQSYPPPSRAAAPSAATAAPAAAAPAMDAPSSAPDQPAITMRPLTPSETPARQPAAVSAAPGSAPVATPAAASAPTYNVGGNQFTLVSGTPPYVAIRPGDVVEVRFYRNTPVESQRYDLAVGDIVSVDVFGFPELSRERVIVLPDGYVSAPLVGSLRAAGKNVDEIGFEIAQKLEAEQILDPQVTVAVVETDRRREALLDKSESGSQQNVTRITVSESGYLNLPYIAPISVIGRGVSEVQSLIREAYREEFGGRVEVTANIVGREAPYVFVMGEVTTPSRVELSGAFNPLMAIAAAGGFNVRADPEQVRVVRVRPDGSYQQYAFNLEADLAGQSNTGANFRLQPQDVVFVPPSGIADANTWVDQWIRQMLPFTLSTGYFPAG